MDTKAMLKLQNGDESAGAVPEVQTAGAIMIFAALVIVLGFVAPLLLALPQTPEAFAGTAPLVHEGGGAEPTFHERYRANATESWVDALEEYR